MADLLSFAEDDSRGKSHPIAADMPANDELTRRFLTSYPSQVPANFAISQLPGEILSWVTQVPQVAESFLTDGKRAATSPTSKGEEMKFRSNSAAFFKFSRKTLKGYSGFIRVY